MAKIVYGVSGEGSGHSSRAREMITFLEQSGHTIKVVSYDRGYINLKDDFDVFETEGLHIASSDNRVSKVKTFTDNLQRLPRGQKKLHALRYEIFKTFQPSCVITDFEPMTAYLAHHYDLPLISIDNQHRIRYMTYPCPARLQKERRMTVNIIRAMVEYKTNKRPFPKVDRVSPSHQTVAKPLFSLVSAVIGPSGPAEAAKIE